MLIAWLELIFIIDLTRAIALTAVAMCTCLLYRTTPLSVRKWHVQLCNINNTGEILKGIVAHYQFHVLFFGAFSDVATILFVYN